MTPSILLLLLSAPLLGLWFLALIVLTFATIYAADPPWKRPEARQKERDEGSVHVVEANHAVAFGLVASCGLLAVWWFPNILGEFTRKKGKSTAEDKGNDLRLL